MKLIDCFIRSLHAATEFDAGVQTAPACILWPDKDRLWELAVPRLLSALPGLFVLGEYSPDDRRGPAIWMRCVLAGKVGQSVPSGQPMIIYLPGVGYSDLRAVATCSDALKPLVELQYRGAVWSQQGYRDWMPVSFFSSVLGGVGLDVAQDAGTKLAVKRSLGVLLDEDTDHLKGKRLDADFFNSLLNTRDPIRDLLTWMDQGDGFWGLRSEIDSQAFVSNCVSKFRFDPKAGGLISAATKLAQHKDVWQDVWKRFCDAPKKYKNIPGRIRNAVAPTFDLFSTAKTHGGWPQWNDKQEEVLLDSLKELDGLPSEKVCEQVIELDKKHSDRRQLVWAEIGEAPLAVAMQPLAHLAKSVLIQPVGTDIDGLVKAYADKGWEADDAALKTSACPLSGETADVIISVLRAIYLPWVDASARKFQALVKRSGYPGVIDKEDSDLNGDVCVFFVDGLRFDLAQRLTDILLKDGCNVNSKISWSGLPSLTATGKPAVSPVKALIKTYGDMKPDAFSPCSDHAFKKGLAEAGWARLEQGEAGDGHGRAWCEFGNIDHEGHDRGMAMAKNLDGIIEEIRQRIQYLIFAGWKKIKIVTDHGWVFMPKGLPKSEIQSVIIEGRGHRCALVKPGAQTSESLYPWSWDPVHSFASPDGVGCYRQGEEYAHGGISLQECLTMELIVTCLVNATPQVSIDSVVWKGLRCFVLAIGVNEGITIDIRRQPADPLSRLTTVLKPLREDGTGSLVVENEDLQGVEAFVVLLSNNDVIAQIPTIIGGGKK